MARTLYRIYLYFMCTAMLGLAAFSLGAVLYGLLRLTPLRGQYESAPSNAELVQSTVLGVIGLFAALALGGLHYWLMRRDIVQDPGAARGAVRSLFLNLIQAVAALFTLYAGAGVLQQIGNPSYGGVSLGLAITLVAAGAFALAQIERSRSEPAPGGALVLQRLHIYGVLTVILLTSIGYSTRVLGDTVTAVFAALKLIPDPCTMYLQVPYGVAPSSCNLAGQLVGEWLAVLWVVAAWGVYFWLARGDARSVLRAVAKYLGLVAGLISVIIGVDRAAELVLRRALGVATDVAAQITNGGFDFISPLVFGLVVMAAYGLWLTREADQSLLGQQGTELTTLALSAIVLGVPFYVAIVQLVHAFLEGAVTGNAPSQADLASSLGLLVSGLAHPFVAFRLRRRTTEAAPIGPRRGFVLAGLAAGAVAAAIGGVIALYLFLTAQLGSPVSDWAVGARTAAVVFLVGAYVAGMHLWRVIAERTLVTRPAPVAPGSTVPVSQTGAIEEVLDQLLAGKITRDQAAAQLRGLMRGDGMQPQS